MKEEPVDYEVDTEMPGGAAGLPLSDRPQPTPPALPASTIPAHEWQAANLPQWRKNRGRPNPASHGTYVPASDAHPVQYRKVRGRSTERNRVETGAYSTDPGFRPALPPAQFEPLASGVVKEEEQVIISIVKFHGDIGLADWTAVGLSGSKIRLIIPCSSSFSSLQ